MGRTKTKSTKKATPSPDKVAEVTSSVLSANVTVRVIKAHDGLETGKMYTKPRELAYIMQEAGFWEIVD